MAVWIKVNKEDISLEELNQLFNNPTNKFDIHYFNGSKGDYYEMEVRGFEDGQQKQAKEELFEQLKNLRRQEEIVNLSVLEQIEYKGEQYLVVYKAQQYRWEETANPEIDDVEYFINENEAKVYAEKIQLNVGFESQVESHFLKISSVSQEDWKREFDSIEEMVNEYDFDDYVETQTIDYNEGKDITGAVVVEWNWEKYPGYCRNLTDIGIAGEGIFYSLKKEKDLITGNEESTWHRNYDVLLTKKEILDTLGKCYTEDEVIDVIYDKLNDSYWKWNDFKNNPNSKNINKAVEEIAYNITENYVFIEKRNGEREDISFHLKERYSNSIDINYMGYEGTLKTNLGRIECKNNGLTSIEAPKARYIHCENNEMLENIYAPNCKELTCENSPLLKEENMELSYDCDIEGLEKRNQLKI